MLKFFRRIRRKLLDGGHLRKYFVYSIGEVFLIVIGILIALGINSWNEKRKNKALEQNYIQELITDLQKDSALIKTLLTKSNAQIRAKYLLQKYLVEHTGFSFYTSNFDHFPEFVKTQNYHKDSLTSYFNSQWRTRYSFSPITTTIDEMKSTGKIGIIRDQHIRRAIIETYNSYEAYELNYQDHYNRQHDEMLRLVFDEVPELYKMDNSNLVDIFKEPRVLNRFEGNYAIRLNSGLTWLKQVNQKLLNELNRYTKKE